MTPKGGLLRRVFHEVVRNDDLQRITTRKHKFRAFSDFRLFITDSVHIWKPWIENFAARGKLRDAGFAEEKMRRR